MSFNKQVILCLIIVIIILVLYTDLHKKVVEHFVQDEPMLQILKNRLYPFFNSKNFTGKLTPLNDSNILDRVDIYENRKESYSLNKKKIYLCLKDKDGKYYHENNLTYVLLHEIAHCISESIDDDPGTKHSDAYYEVFNQLIDEASKQGYYDPTIEMPDVYCNIKLR